MSSLSTSTRTTPSAAVEAYLESLAGNGTLIALDWPQWLGIGAPFAETPYRSREVSTRYQRNGYDWDIHGRLYTPTQEVDPGVAFIMIHGAWGHEMGLDSTPDGRPGLATTVASQGIAVLSITYPGHYPPGGIWTVPSSDRQPVYLLDRVLSRDETLDRNLKCSFNVILQGAGQLIDETLAGRRVMAFGHSTGGPMAAHLHRFVTKVTIAGLPGFGSGGPNGWLRDWRDLAGADVERQMPLDGMSRLTDAAFKASGYEDPLDLCPWGGLDAPLYRDWVERSKSKMKTALCFNQHVPALGMLEEHARAAGLPREEVFDHLGDPSHDWVRDKGVLLVVGENDKLHWTSYGDRVEDKCEYYIARRYQDLGARAKVVLIPRYGHIAYIEIHNEKIAYLWLWALREGFFRT